MKAFFAKVWNAIKGAFSKAWSWSLGHKAIAIAVAATVVVGTTCAIALPIALHNHKFAEEWCTDAENHWHTATCKHEEEKSDTAAHTYDNACDTKCDVCGYVRTAGAHTYDNACDTTCNTCGVTRTVDPHAYDNACDTTCNTCGATRTVDPHAYDDACDTTCNTCGATRTVNPHVYENACDTTCNTCGATRTVDPHAYDNACDTTCNTCGATRTVDPHAYDNACDTTCNTCGATRTVGPHAYDNACDTACNNCGATRQITHTFNVESATTATLKAEATADAKAQYWKSCACGAISTTEYFETGKIMGTITDIQDISKTYDAERVDIPTYVTNSTGAVTIEWYRISGMELSGAPKNSGAYKVKITIAETETHTGVSEEKEFVIGMAQATLTNVAVSPVTVKYGDHYYITHTTEGDGTVTVEYKVCGASDETYTTEQPTNAGEYTARVTLADGTNYLGTSATVDFEIEQFVLAGLDSLYTEFVYNGEAVHEIDLSSEGYTGVTVVVTFEDADAASAVVSVKVLEYEVETGNYVLDVENCGTTIIPRVVEIEWTAPENLRFDGTQKVPSAVLTNVVPGDDCVLVLMIDGNDGEDNVWYGSTFTYSFSIEGADVDNANYALPDNTYSPEYTIEIDATVNLGEEADIGSTSLYSDSAPYIMYYSIELEEGCYYFSYIGETQGASFVFNLFAKGELGTSIVNFSVEDASKESNVFYLEAGEYYVKVESSDVAQGDKLIIFMHEHAGIDDYGFCTMDCGTYLGDTIETNEAITLSLTTGDKAYYRVPYTYGHLYGRSFVAPLQSGDFAFYYYDGSASAWQEIDWFNATPEDKFAGVPEDGYIYVVITAGAEFEDGTFTMLEKHGGSYGFCTNQNCGYVGELLVVGEEKTLTLKKGQPVYLRFELESQSTVYDIQYVGDHTNVTVTCYGKTTNGQFMEQVFGAAAIGSSDGYYYLVIEYDSQTLIPKKITFTVGEAT